MSIQGTDEWLNERLGHCTASCFSDVLAKGEGKMRRRYMRQLVAERLTGKPIESWSGAHMARGKEQEPLARIEYQSITGLDVEQVGFIRHQSLMAGASPDGLIGTDGGVEIKSVIPTVQLETIERGLYPPEHVAQVQGNLWITGRKWWDFVSYCPDYTNEVLRLYRFRVERDEAYIAELDAQVAKFLDEVDAMVRKYTERKAI